MVSEPYTFFSEKFEIDHVKPEPDHDYWGTAGTTEVRRTISPYDLTSADKPGVVISHPFLKETNYDEWAYGMKTALKTRKKFGFLDGTISKPADDSSDLEDWWTIQGLLVSWIKNYNRSDLALEYLTSRCAYLRFDLRFGPTWSMLAFFQTYKLKRYFKPHLVIYKRFGKEHLMKAN
ncbi:unnamed protein product [Brassica rapa]|uniref:Retrotransposon Copia-like N-terminal domain-containing protein n=2 Tax=Brassica TaxID=3705 RepID=A0A8D9HEG3_BRACM|nr:unnamed protein product [Brassica napus]CAG7898109.1 unnamed protein product [Brassica rapa]